MTKIMWIEKKSGESGLSGPARIGRVSYSKSDKSIKYNGMTFQSLKGTGFKANYFDVESGDEYWISGCRKDGNDALYNTDVEIDEDVLEEYWVGIRKGLVPTSATTPKPPSSNDFLVVQDNPCFPTESRRGLDV